MKESFFEKKKEIDRQLLHRARERDSEGRAVINMTVEDDSNFLSVFSSTNTPTISTDVADFIESNTHALPPNSELTLRVFGDCIDEQEKLIYNNAVKEYYSEKYIENERELKRNRWIVLLLSIVGIAVLALAILLEYKTTSAIWTEVVDIVAWVLLWEAVYISAFENRSLCLKRLRYMNYMSMKTEFYPLEQCGKIN